MKEAQIEVIRHSLSHVLAMAVCKEFPEAKLGIGPSIENGFYYDFELPRTLGIEDLPKIEKQMRRILTQPLEFQKSQKTVKEALEWAKKSDQPYKKELIDDLAKGEKEVSFYGLGEFVDLCAGPHVKGTAELRSVGFKLERVSGAYWKGSEKNKMLQRIYGVAFNNQEELDAYFTMIEEARKRDHRKLGPELGLFMFHETAPGMPYWLPNGLTVLNELTNFWRLEHKRRGYVEVKTPLINKKELYEISGHWDHYKEEMFIAETDENETYALKPMNCPNAMIIYGSKKRSYRELPLRLGDTDTLHRNERSGTLNGLLRARSFSQDDAHIFIAEDQIETEVRNIFEIIDLFYSIFDLEYSFRLGTRPDDFMGEPKLWDKAEKELEKILKESQKKYFILEGDGAFYGPKIDILMKDSLGREWQMGTIQLDFQIPRRFNLSYVDQKGQEKIPVVIHRVVYGSLERFMGILTEHFAGAFPLWLAPTQAKILPIADRHLEYSKGIAAELEEAGLRVKIDDASETVGKKIRQAEMEKVPFMLIVGDKELEAKKVSVRSYKEGDLGQKGTTELTERIKKEIRDKK